MCMEVTSELAKLNAYLGCCFCETFKTLHDDNIFQFLASLPFLRVALEFEKKKDPPPPPPERFGVLECELELSLIFSVACAIGPRSLFILVITHRFLTILYILHIRILCCGLIKLMQQGLI